MSAEGVERFGRDSTLRWSMRAGDYLLWVRCTAPFTSGQDAFSIRDFWELHDGDYVTISNRMADLPAWFQLHPTEIRNALAFEMMRRLDEGYVPGPSMDGPNLWRALSGDRLVWVGPPRASVAGSGPVLIILEFDENALVVGESTRAMRPHEPFGVPEQDELPPEVAALLRHGFQSAVRLGVPRTLASDWALG